MSTPLSSVCEERVYAKVFRDYAKVVRNFILFKCGNEAQADDLTQDAFVKLWKNCAKVPLDKVKSFLFTVVKNDFFNEVAHQKVKLKFQQTKKDTVNKEEIDGELKIAVKVGLFEIKGEATVETKDNSEYHMNEIKVTSYTDFIIEKQPTTIPKTIELKKLRGMLVKEDSVAGGYDLMDIVALKIIERSKIKTRVIQSDIKTLEKAVKGLAVGTEIVLPKK